MDYLTHAIAIGLLLSVVAGGWLLTLLGLPGNWLMVLTAATYTACGPWNGVAHLSWSSVGGLAVLAGVGELLELLAGMWGAHRAGGSRRAALYALAGSLGGAFAGATVGIPIPIVGSAVGAIVGAALGALAGAMMAEYSQGEAANKSWRVGQAAFWGRLLGTGAKLAVGTVMVLLIVIALIV